MWILCIDFVFFLFLFKFFVGQYFWKKGPEPVQGELHASINIYQLTIRYFIYKTRWNNHFYCIIIDSFVTRYFLFRKYISLQWRQRSAKKYQEMRLVKRKHSASCRMLVASIYFAYCNLYEEMTIILFLLTFSFIYILIKDLGNTLNNKIAVT